MLIVIIVLSVVVLFLLGFVIKYWEMLKTFYFYREDINTIANSNRCEPFWQLVTMRHQFNPLLNTLFRDKEFYTEIRNPELYPNGFLPRPGEKYKFKVLNIYVEKCEYCMDIELFYDDTSVIHKGVDMCYLLDGDPRK